MAGHCPLVNNIEPVAESVQEIALGGGEPPERYCCRDGGVGSLDTYPPMDIAVIDIGLLASPSPSPARQQQLEKLRSALISFGSFMAINHGITSSFLDEVHSTVKQFFALPVVEKQKYAGQVKGREGYGNDGLFADNKVLHWNDRLSLLLSPEERRHLQFWPKNPANFRETISEYCTRLQLIIEVVLKAMAVSLNLDEHSFLDKYGDQPIMRSRFNFYPPCSRHDRVIGLNPHTDPSIITIVLQDKEVEGLQILKDDQWYKVPIYPDGLLINTGDQMEILSNGLLKNPLHRVVINPEKERISLAIVCYPDPENDIEPVNGLVDQKRPRLYKKVRN